MKEPLMCLNLSHLKFNFQRMKKIRIFQIICILSMLPVIELQKMMNSDQIARCRQLRSYQGEPPNCFIRKHRDANCDRVQAPYEKHIAVFLLSFIVGIRTEKRTPDGTKNDKNHRMNK